jgi:carboxyl-terminal processing protease
VVSPLEDSPAYRAGIKAGDIIARINGKDARGISITQAVKTITGPSGTLVTLTIRHPSTGASKDYTIKRETIKVASLKGWSHKPGGGWDYMIDPDQKIAYFRLTNFTKTSREELDRAIDEISHQGARGIILDLRGNPGGLLNAATEICDKFLSKGIIVSTHADRDDTPNAPTISRAKPDPDDVTLPLVVLVNQYSASASEIVSGCLKDDKRALIVGERTFGKGSVQMLFRLAEGQACLKLTTSHYYLPNGRCIHREENSITWGVDPDVTIEMTPDQMRLQQQAQLDMEVLRDAGDAAPADPNKKPDPALEKAERDPLGSDAQLSGGLLLLRLQLAGAQI